LSHPSLPEVVKYLAQGSNFFLLLDSSKGKSLQEYLYPGTMSDGVRPNAKPTLPRIERVIRWATELAEALLYLHEQKPFPIPHRGLNPLTVMITQSTGRVRLADFGLLNSFRAAASHAEDGRAPFSADVFADPQLLGKNWPDPRTDIYAFGKILDFMLTGVVPTEPGSRLSFPQAATMQDDKMRSSLVDILTRCCQKSPAKRYQNMDSLLADLARLSSEDGAQEDQPVRCSCGHLNPSNSKFCQRCGLLLQTGSLSVDTNAPALPIEVSYSDEHQAKLLEHYQQGALASLSRFRMREALEAVQSDPGFDQLISLEALPAVSKLPHQREAAYKALRQMRGRVLLADEVGLGKTIEAGIILKELVLRRLAPRILIFCPVQLLGQWQSELYEKFDEIFLVFGRDIDTSLAWHCPRLIVPYGIAQQRLHIEEMLRHRYDLVILDEAHCLNYPENWRILRTMKNLQKKYFLLLSATPMHNSLEELYNIITLLRPGHFDDLKRFKEQFVDPEDETRPRNTEELRRYLQEVMVRNSRRQVVMEYPFPERDASTVPLILEPPAIAFYSEFRDFYRRSLANVGSRQFLLRMGEIVERLCSSPDAFREPINLLRRDRYAQKHLGQEFIRKLEHFAARYPSSLVEPKISETVDILRQFVRQGQKVLVFSQFNETAIYVHRRVCETDLRERCILYNEKDPYEQRMKSLRDFRESDAGILFCPGEASEGLNLQFASVMVNFDLPWDPMKIEQRIGRIQRIGAKQKVIIVNLVLKGTIEEEILKICQDKIRMFGEVIGQVEEILGNLREEDDFRAMICNLYLDRPVENDEGQLVDPGEYIDERLKEADEQSSAEQSNVLNSIFFDFSEPVEDV
jgi:serine/threonine protein kinase/ERCC4-related helicase